MNDVILYLLPSHRLSSYALYITIFAAAVPQKELRDCHLVARYAVSPANSYPNEVPNEADSLRYQSHWRTISCPHNFTTSSSDDPESSEIVTFQTPLNKWD